MKRCLAVIIAAMTLISLLGGCQAASTQEPSAPSLVSTGKMELQFAKHFQVEYYEGGYKMISFSNGSRFFTVPEGAPLPEDLAEDVVVLQQPIKNIYLAATASMCLFDALDRLDAVRLSSIKANDWTVVSAKQAMKDKKILFAGKYSEPDYELLMKEGCSLALESTMIGHVSDVKDKLEELGIPVLMDIASMEPHPLGRTEWIRMYAALLNEEEKADQLFNEQVALMNDAIGCEPTGKTVSFFYITSSGRVVARKSGDYVSKMIEMAGGEYVFQDLGDPEKLTATVTIEMETFYAAAKDADYMIYNPNMGGMVSSLEELIEMNEVLKDFKAVQNGNVWCTGLDMYQQTTQLGEMIQSFHAIFSGEADDLNELPFLYRLR